MNEHNVMYIEARGHRQYVCECGWRGVIFSPASRIEDAAAEIQRDLHMSGLTSVLGVPPLLTEMSEDLGHEGATAMIFEKFGKQMDDAAKAMVDMAKGTAELILPKGTRAEMEFEARMHASNEEAIRRILASLGEEHLADAMIWVGKDYSKQQLRHDLTVLLGEGG